MSILWADGFDHWKDTDEFFTVGGYQFGGAGVNGSRAPFVGDAEARTGPRGQQTWQTQRFGEFMHVAKQLPNRQTAGLSFALLVKNNPSDGEAVGAGFMQKPYTNSTIENMGINVRPMPGGILGVFLNRGSTVPLAQTAPNTILIGAYQQIEMKCFCHPTQGNLEIRVEGQQVLALENINTDPAGNLTLCGYMYGTMLRNQSLITSYVPAWDDFVYWDTLGTASNDFLGNVRCRTLRPSADIPGAEGWTPATGNDGFAMISGIPSDAKFINATDVGSISAFELDNVPDNTAYCESVFAFVLSNKTDAGVCEITPAIQSGNAAQDLAPITPGTGRSYATYNIPLDPATGNYWTKEGINAARFVVTRTK